MVKQRRKMPKPKKEKQEKAKLSEFLHKKTEGRQNDYVFKGFYDRLNSISVKLGHNSINEVNYLQQEEATRYLMGFGSYEPDDEEKVQLSSNFISLLRANLNPSVEFKEMYSELQPLISSYNLMLLKKDEIIDILMTYIEVEDNKAKNPHLTISIIDLLVALIKDFRKEISFETLFIEKIFPKIISLINITELELLEHIMHFFSHVFKFLLPTILSNFQRFFSLYYPLLSHRHKFIKKFASESFSYILRKCSPSNLPKLILIWLTPLKKGEKRMNLPEVENSQERNKEEWPMEVEEKQNDAEKIMKFSKDQSFLYTHEVEELKESDNYEDLEECVEEHKSKSQLPESSRTLNSDLKNNKLTTKDSIPKHSFKSNPLHASPKDAFISCCTVAGVFTETIYGVQKRLFTQWKQILTTLFEQLNKFQRSKITVIRSIVVQILNRWDPQAVGELVEFLIGNLDGECKLRVVKDLVVFKQGQKLDQKATFFIIKALYKLLKESIKQKRTQDLNLLVEWLYLGFFNKTDQFLDIFNMEHETKLTDMIEKLGREYILHFYKLASVEDINQKIYDSSLYHIMLMNKFGTNLSSKYIRTEKHRMKILFKPLWKYIFSLEGEGTEYLMTCLWIFLTIKSKSELEELIEIPERFLSILESKVREIEQTMKEEDQDFTNETLNTLWIFTKILSLWPKNRSFPYLLSKTSSLLHSDSLKRHLPSSTPNLFFLPSPKGYLTHLLCLQSNLLRLQPCPPTALYPSPAYLSSLSAPLPTYLASRLEKMLLSPSFKVRREVVRLLAGGIHDEREKEVIGLIRDVSAAPPGLGSERVYGNSIQKLMNLYRTKEMGIDMQRIYLYFLVSMFFLKFTPVYTHAQKAIGELIEVYQESIMGWFEEVLDFIEEYIKTPPNHESRWEHVPNNRKLFVYRKYEIDDDPQKLENRHSTAIKVFEWVLKGYGYAVETVSDESKKRLTERFKKFLNDEFLQWHPEFAKYLRRDVVLCKDEEDIMNRMIDANSIETINYAHQFRRNTTLKLISYLPILQEVGEIKDMLMILLSSNDAQIQNYVLRLLFKLNVPEINKFEKSLLVFNSDTDFKDEITKFSLDEDKFKPKERAIVLPLIIRILNSKLLKKKGKASAKPLEAKRTMVYRFLASLSQDELKIFIQQVIEPFSVTLEDTEREDVLEAKLSQWGFGQYIGYVSSLEGIIKNMGLLIKDYLPSLCNILVTILKLSKLFESMSKEKDEEDMEIDDNQSNEEEGPIEDSKSDASLPPLNPLKKNTLKSWHSCITLCLKRIKDIYSKYYHLPTISAFSSCLIPLLPIAHLPKEHITSISSLLWVLEEWSCHRQLHPLFLESKAIAPMCEVISIQRGKVNQQVVVAVVNMFASLCGRGLDEKRDEIMGEVVAEEVSHKVIRERYADMVKAMAKFLENYWEVIRAGVVGKGDTGDVMDGNRVFRSIGFVRTVVFILSELSKYVGIDQKEELEQMTDMFIPLITVKGFATKGKEDLVNDTLQTVQKLWEKMPSLITKKRFYQMSKLLTENLKLSCRRYLCNLLAVIPNYEAKENVLLVKKMNKIKKGYASALLDADKAILAINKFEEERLATSTYEESIVILFQMIHFMTNSELSLRTSAILILDKFLDKYYNDVNEYAKADMRDEMTDLKERSYFIAFHFLPGIRSWFNTQADELVVKSCLKLFKKYLIWMKMLNTNEETKSVWGELCVPKEYLQMTCLIDEKDEFVDFFENILNIKLQRRYRAIRQLWTKIEEKELTDLKTLTKIILPIADMFIIRMSQAQSLQRGVITYTKQNFDQINNECYLLYTKVCEHLPWNLYQNIMRKNIIKITGVNLKKGQRMSPTGEKHMTKVICAIISGFHFDVPDVVDQVEAACQEKQKTSGLSEILSNIFGIKKKKQKNEDEGLASDSEQSDKEEEEDEVQDKIEQLLDEPQDQKSENRQAIQNTLIKSFIPALFKHLKEPVKDGDGNDDVKIRLHVAVAIVRILRKTTNQQFSDGFNKLIRNIVGCLRSKILKIRERAREVLVQVNLNVSAYLIHYTIDEMQKSLRKGYQRHVRSFTLHHLLESLVKENHLKVGQLDHWLDSKATFTKGSSLEASKTNQAITNILLDELFGKLGAEKELEGTYMVKIKETKSKRALQTYELLSQYIDFESTFIKLIAPVLEKADTSTKLPHLKKCEEILSIISSSILKNPSVKAEPLLVILYAIMKKGTTEEDKMKEEDQVIEEKEYKKPDRKKMEMQTYKVLPNWQRDIVTLRKVNNETSRNLMVSFSLSTLKKSMGLLPIEDFKDKLDSFVKLYVDLMKSNDNKVVVNTLHILGKSIRLSLPSIKYYCRKIINNLFILFTSSSDPDFMNSLFKCTTEMVRYMKEDLTDHQLGRLIEIIKANLEHYQMQANVYGWLKALVDRKVMNSHLYDLVDIVADKMITHVNNNVRTVSAQIFILFLISYPLSEHRVEQHIHHLIKNLTYVAKEGRLTVLEVIEKLIPQLPTEILDKYSFLLFLSMILRTVNDSSPECKQKANSNLKSLLENVSDSKRDDIIKTVLNWDYNAAPEFDEHIQDQMGKAGKSAMMKRVTLLLISLIITIEGDKFASKYFAKTFEICKSEVIHQADSLRQLYSVNRDEEDREKEEETQIDNVRKEMGDFLQEIALISKKDMEGSYKRQKLGEEVSQEECLTLSATLNIIEKFIQNDACWKIFYKNCIGNSKEQEFTSNLLELWDHYYVNKQMCKIIQTLFTKLEESKVKYKEDGQIKFVIDDLSLRLARMFEFIEQDSDLPETLSNVLVFITLNLIERNDEESKARLEKMFDKCSFIGRKIMININQNQHKLISVLKFYVWVITAISDSSFIKLITKQILFLVYRTYTNPKLSKTDAKTISVEIIELLQRKLEQEPNEFLRIFTEVKEIIEKQKQERKKNEKLLAVKNVDAFKKKRQRKHQRKKENDRKKNFMHNLAKYS